MDDDNFLPFSLPAVCRKKVSVAFDGGLLSSDGGVMRLRDVERRVGLAERLAGCLTDRRDPARTDHELIEMLRLRMFLIAAGYKMPTTATRCVAIRCSSWPWDGCRRAAMRCARNRPCRGWRTRHRRSRSRG